MKLSITDDPDDDKGFDLESYDCGLEERIERKIGINLKGTRGHHVRIVSEETIGADTEMKKIYDECVNYLKDKDGEWTMRSTIVKSIIDRFDKKESNLRGQLGAIYEKKCRRAKLNSPGVYMRKRKNNIELYLKVK